MTLVVQEKMKDNGVHEESYRIMRGMRALDAGLGSSYAELVATYSVFRINGKTHDETISQLGALMDAIDVYQHTPEGR